MLAAFPQARLVLTLGLATVLGVIAVAMLAFSADRRAGDRATTTAAAPVPTAVAQPATVATPGSTAHARQVYRTSLGR